MENVSVPPNHVEKHLFPSETRSPKENQASCGYVRAVCSRNCNRVQRQDWGECHRVLANIKHPQQKCEAGEAGSQTWELSDSVARVWVDQRRGSVSITLGWGALPFDRPMFVNRQGVLLRWHSWFSKLGPTPLTYWTLFRSIFTCFNARKCLELKENVH